MSSPLAIGAVSAVLRNLLDNGIVDVGVPIGSVDVTAVAPDTIDLDDGGEPSLNVFLHRVSRNTGWENAALPARDGNGSRITNKPLALNLHYLITAYGRDDFEAEILLGYAMHLLHERPVLDRASIRRALDPSPLDTAILPAAFQALTASDLADQIETVTITHEPIDTEEMSRLWAAIQTHYRPSAGYVATVVLIEARKPSQRGLPVLSRGIMDLVTGRDRGPVANPDLVPPFPTLERVAISGGRRSALLGDTVELQGHHLDGTGLVVDFEHRLLADPNQMVVGNNPDSTKVSLAIPSTPAAEVDWPAGLYTVTVQVLRPGEATPRRSNAAAMFLAPDPTYPPTAIGRNATTGRISVTIQVSPELRPEQDAVFSLGSHSASVEPHPTATSNLDFELGVVPQGLQWAQLTVDGVDSLLVDHTKTPPIFEPSHSVTVPA